MSTWPSTLSSLTDPAPSDRLNSPSHSSIESNQNDAIEKLETFIGTLSSAVGTIVYDVRAAASDGGGHVQAANRGGTGQTSFTKGDMLVASSSSVIGKLAAGTDNQILTADSSTASGVKWAASPANRIYSNASVISISSTQQASIVNTTIPGSTLLTANAVRTVAYIGVSQFSLGSSMMAAVNYGGGVVASVMLNPISMPTSSWIGQITHTMIANNSASAQRHFLEWNIKGFGADSGVGLNPTVALFTPFSSNIGSIFTIGVSQNTTSSVNSSANQTYGIIFQQHVASGNVNFDGSLVEKIIS